MATEPLRRRGPARLGGSLTALGAALLLAGSGCAARSIASDVRKVRQLSGASKFHDVTGEHVDPELDQDARALLDRPLDSNAAVRIALLNNRALRARLRELGISRGRMIQAGVFANPVLEAEVAPERDSHLELRVEYDLTSLLYAPRQRRAAAADLEAARYQAANDVVTLGYRVRSAFYELQAATLRMLMAQRTLDSLAAGRDAAVALVEAGNIPALDAANQVAAFERARISVAQLELELARKRESVQRLLGLHGERTNFEVNASFASLPDELSLAEDLETRALKASLNMSELRARLEASSRRTGIARLAAWLPEVSVDVHALYLNQRQNVDDPNIRWGGGVSLGVPLFDRQQGTRRMYEAEFDGLLERYQGLAIDLRSSVRDARNELVSAHLRAQRYLTVIVPAQNTVMEQTELQYNAMQVSVFQLLEARRQQLQVQLEAVETQLEYWRARAGLEALMSGALIAAEDHGARPPLSGQSPEGGH